MSEDRTKLDSENILLDRIRAAINAHLATNKMSSIELIGILDVLKMDAWNEMGEEDE